MASSFLRLTVLSASLALTACASLKPEPLSRQDIARITQQDAKAVQADVVPLDGPLSLEEAIARAIKYNADRRTRQMEEVVAKGNLDAAAYDLLPRLVLSAGYRDRSNDLLTLSQDLATGTVIGGKTISSNRDATSTDLTFSWSLLDFGQSYYAAQQNADRFLIAGERRRKALHTLMQDVRTAYWRVVSAQKLGAELRSAMTEAEKALADARKVEAEGLRSPLEPLRYQRQVLESLRLLESIEQELSTARIELSQLINAPLGQKITVIEPEESLASAWRDMPVDKMEAQALARNADIREGAYNARIARVETRKAMVKLFPGLSFNYALRHSDDSYLVNQSWNETGLQLSFNLLGMLSAFSQKRLAEAGVVLADQKRMTTQMAVLAQLHIARQQYENALRQLERAEAIAQVDSRITRHVINQEEAAKQTKLDRVAQQTASILSQLRRYQALSNAHAAASKLQASLGLEPRVSASREASLPELTAQVATALKAWSEAALPGTDDTDAEVQ